MGGELLRFSNKSDFCVDSHMVLPGGSEISSGEGFENKKHLLASRFQVLKASVKKPAGSKCLCSSGLGLNVLDAAKRRWCRKMQYP